MPKPLPLPTEARFRDALRTLLQRLGVLRPSFGIDPSDDEMIGLASVVELRRDEFAVCPELDADIPF